MICSLTCNCAQEGILLWGLISTFRTTITGNNLDKNQHTNKLDSPKRGTGTTKKKKTL